MTNTNTSIKGWRLEVFLEGKQRTFTTVETKESLILTLDKKHRKTAKRGIWTRLTSAEYAREIAEIDSCWDNY